VRQKALRDILVLSGSLVFVLSLLFTFNFEKRLWLSQKVSEKINLTKTTPVPAKECAEAGEEPVGNFDERTGKTDESIKVINCCEGLRPIQKKQDRINRTTSGSVVCAAYQGVSLSICAPCGNGKCDTAYEDICNCPKDCR